MYNNIKIENFLNGKVRVYQSDDAYKSGVDAVLLSSIVQAKQGDKILDVGCGVGVASLCLAYRMPSILVCGIEKNLFYYDLAVRNQELNNYTFQPIYGNILTYKCDHLFDSIMCNPPYYINHDNKELTLKESGNIESDATLKDFVNFTFYSIKNHGYLYMIIRSERLQELISYLSINHWGNLEIFPIYSYVGKEAKRFILKAKKLGKPVSKMHYGIVMHQNNNTYTEEAINILREGKAFMCS
jgi:tRNA1(Val) A37 N6-methylase TrmN6